MAKTNYQRGAAKELRIVNKFRAIGCISFRSAGSHSPIDVVVIDPKTWKIKLIQSKLGYLSPKKKIDIITEGQKLNGEYMVTFELWD